jgi:hypothetical protein
MVACSNIYRPQKQQLSAISRQLLAQSGAGDGDRTRDQQLGRL